MEIEFFLGKIMKNGDDTFVGRVFERFINNLLVRDVFHGSQLTTFMIYESHCATRTSFKLPLLSRHMKNSHKRDYNLKTPK